MKTRHVCLFALLLGLGCGNYSNEDLDFQLALPQETDLTAKLPLTAVDASTAEYYGVTRDVVLVFNTLIGSVTGIVDHVRRLPPSERRPGLRIWGPFPDRKQPGWDVRMIMTLETDTASPLGYQLRYAIQVQPSGAGPGTWLPFIDGSFTPESGGPRHGRGRIQIDLTMARAGGYPEPEFRGVERLNIAYERASYPHRVVMDIVNTVENPSPGSTSTYHENADGSGSLTFVWRRNDDAWVQAVGVLSRWLPTGAGRADARVIEGLGAMGNPLGIDCWGPDARATYVLRQFGNRRDEGAPETCVFGPTP